MRTVTTLPVTELTVGPQYDSSTERGNWDTNRQAIVTVVIHTMDGTVQSADARFNDPTSNVSAHYGVGLDGKLYHWVDETNVAYHAGSYPVNQTSIGIEHEDGGHYNDQRPDALYTASANLVRDICAFYQIPINRSAIRKHSEVSENPTLCPDALDIDRIVREAAGSSASSLLRVSAPGALKTEPNHTSAAAIDPAHRPVTLRVGDLVMPTGHTQTTAGEAWTEVRLPAPSPVHGWFLTNRLTGA
jgi:N-acetyl-anhydromuramyl-L-alanine amidase AmpD